MRWGLEPLAPVDQGLFNDPQNPGLLGYIPPQRPPPQAPKQPPMSYQPVAPQEGYQPPQQGTTLGSMAGPAYQAAAANVFGSGPSLFEQEAARRAAAGGDVQRYMNDPRGVAIASAIDFTSPIKAWHASPHLFPEFDLSKMGTGEGAQAYGRGMYTGENKAVPEEYFRRFAATVHRPTAEQVLIEGRPLSEVFHTADSMTLNTAARALNTTGGDVPAAVAHVKTLGTSPYYQEVTKRLEQIGGRSVQIKPREGPYMYELTHQADPPDFFDLDKTIYDQSPHVREKLSPIIEDLRGMQHSESDLHEMTGEELMHRYGDDVGFANTLREQGIPGIRYLDELSRDLPGGKIREVSKAPYTTNWRAIIDTKHGTEHHGNEFPTEAEARAWAEKAINTPETHNMVFFDPSHVQIEKINEQPPGHYFPGLLVP